MSKENQDVVGATEFTTYETVKNESTKDYFRGNQFSIDAFEKKYALVDNPNETYVQALKRVCDYVASVEKTEALKEYWSKRWFHEIYNDWWHPAGSIMQGAGSGRKISLCNCTTVTLGTGREAEEWDSLEAIIKNAGYTIAKAAAYRQGLGLDFSRLRPRGSTVLNSAKESTGSVHWMSYMDGIGNFVGQKGRIPAMLFSLSCNHPDVEEFITVKANTGKIQNANISVQCTDDFYEAVRKDKNWDLTFEIPEVKKGQKVYVDGHSITMDCKKDEKGWYYIAHADRKKDIIKKTVKARDLMQLIAKNMHSHAEPGIQNIDIARKYSNSDYVYDPEDEYDPRIVSTNACSEQYLSRESLCVLSSLNCGRLSVTPDAYEKELSILCPSINRFLDNVNECELYYHTYATPHQRLAIRKLRRTGAGLTNIAAWLFEQNTVYGSSNSAEKMEDLAERYAYHLYKSSIELGAEKGSFELFNQEKLERSPFIKRMKKLGLEFKTLRNITLISIAPTGTLSLMFRDLVMSYGIEPAFGMYYWKRTRMAGKYCYYFNVPAIVRKVFKAAGHEIPISSDTIIDDWKGSKGRVVAEFIEAHKEKVGIAFKSATDIKSTDKLELMAKVMKWVDSSISVTYMLPENSDWKDVYNFILEAHEKEVKSIAAFPDKKMYGIVSFIPFKDLAIKLKGEGVFIHNQNFSDDELQELSMSRENIILQTATAPKRQPVLDADIHSINVNKEKFIIVVGLQNGVPYEIFGGKMNGLKIEMESKHLQGKISKVKRGQYSLEFEETIIKDFSKQFTPVEKILFRSLSLMLRHGIPIVYIVDQLNKADDNMFSVSAATCRVLKKYIKEGQKVTGRVCPNCGSSDLFYNNGCVVCSNCNHSACG
jgi:ribonucleoside-diphosphate reductase alpha chain